MVMLGMEKPENEAQAAYVKNVKKVYLHKDHVVDPNEVTQAEMWERRYK